MTKEKNKNKRLAVLIGGVILMLAVFGGVFTYLYRSFGQVILDTQRDQLITIAQNVSHSMELYLDNAQDTANTLVSLQQFRLAEAECRQGEREEMERFLDEAIQNRNDSIRCAQFSDPTVSAVVKVGEDGTYTLFRVMGTDENYPMVTINKRKEDGEFFFGIGARTENGNWLTLYLSMRDMFKKTCEYIQMGENGYVMIKDSAGIILMHQVEAQIGIDVLADRKLEHPDFDFSELEVLIAHQLEGRTDVEIYNSYWWADENPQKTKKISAYMPLYLGDDFISISAVMNYSEITSAIESAGIRIVLLSILMLSLFAVLIVLLGRSLRKQQITESENRDLQRINVDLERRRKEEELQAHQQRLELIGTMTSGIAHEFNNLLTPILGYSSLLLMGMQEDDENYEDVKEIYDTAEKAKSIIGQITRFSGKNSEQMMHQIHISDALKKALVLAEASKRRNITMITEVETEPDICMGNPLQIQQMVMNLCNNAIHAMGQEKGELTVLGEICTGEERTDEYFRKRPGQSYYRITVKDTGCGMTKETMEQIFVPFFTTKRPGEGTGLGLAVVQRQVEAHDGFITVESEPGKGTSFYLYFPLLTENVSEKTVDPYQ